MANTLLALTWLLVALAFAPALWLFMQSVLSMRPKKNRFADMPAPPVRTTVIIPAHNEGANIGHTLRSVKTNAPNADILVVADNCSDDTAGVARRAGVQVLQRTHATQRGKAFALGFAIEALRDDPPAAVVVIDADAKVKGDSLERLAALAVTWNRPVQSLNVIDRSRSPSSMSTLTILGNRLHNIVRPLALQRIGCPCLLMGSGMAFPWQAAVDVGLANDSLGEDKQLGIDMTLAGYPPQFYLETKVASHIAEHGQGYLGQRMRWEQGHLLVAVQVIPALIWQAIAQGRWDYLAIAADLAVPPIAILGSLAVVAVIPAIGVALTGNTWPIAAVTATWVMLVLTLGVTWLAFARRRVGVRDLLALPGYVARKIPIYVSFLCKGPQRLWLRTERHGTKQQS